MNKLKIIFVMAIAFFSFSSAEAQTSKQNCDALCKFGDSHSIIEKIAKSV